VISQDLVDALLDPGAYPHRPATVRLVQTHISCVFLAGDEVFKLKKPVRFSFLDFSTLERRRHFCEEEVRLNRRLAPDVYLGVVPITRDAARYRVGGDGEVVDYAVRMRHLPDDRLLRQLVTTGSADAALMATIAAKMAAFHASAAADPTVELDDAVDDLSRTMRENVAALAPFTNELRAADDLETLQRLLLSGVHLRGETLRARQRAGRVRDCHGDLRPDHICCTDALPIFDCIEFSPRIRHCDVASEMAFLAMELEFLGARPLGGTLIDAYVTASGDRELPDVLPIFQAHRALIRAMVAALTSGETEIAPDARERLRDDARRYLAIAERNGWAAHPPMIVAIAGRSGSGKSTLAAPLSARTDCAWIRSDVVRKRLAGLASLDRPADAATAERLYAPERSAELYAAIAVEAEARIADGRGVIIDATFHRQSYRAPLHAVAARTGTPLVWIECRADDATVRARLDARAVRADDPSDATWDVAQAQTRDYQPLDEIRDADRLALITDDASVARAYRWLVDRVADA